MIAPAHQARQVRRPPRFLALAVALGGGVAVATSLGWLVGLLVAGWWCRP